MPALPAGLDTRPGPSPASTCAGPPAGRPLRPEQEPLRPEQDLRGRRSQSIWRLRRRRQWRKSCRWPRGGRGGMRGRGQAPSCCCRRLRLQPPSMPAPTARSPPLSLNAGCWATCFLTASKGGRGALDLAGNLFMSRTQGGFDARYKAGKKGARKKQKIKKPNQNKKESNRTADCGNGLWRFYTSLLVLEFC